MSQQTTTLPLTLERLVALSWLLLLGGRWILAPFLNGLGLLPAETLAIADEMVLLKLYWVLLAITLVVVALRGVRGSTAAPSPETPETKP